MRFVVAVAEIIGNLSASAQDVEIFDGGHPCLAIWDISVALMRSLPCFNRALSCLSVIVARVASGRAAMPT